MFLIQKIKARRINFFIRYCIIGFLSISIELLIRKILFEINVNQAILTIVPLIIGITFAFIANISFNFKIPRFYYKKSFLYFSIISISSFTFQYFLSKFFIFKSFNYEITRFIISGTVFLIAYNFHIKFSFAKNKKVGVAIYLDSSENINDIFSKVEFYPDYIHVDFVDKTMNQNVEKPNFDKFNEIRAKWPNHRIESHIMSKTPIKYIEKFSKYSDVIYFHIEIDEQINDVKNLIEKYNIKPGLVLHASKNYKNIEDLVKSYTEILILCIEKPGESGQEFIDESNNIIKSINNLKVRDKLNLCVDGGLSQKNISKIECEKIVSASNVFSNSNPKKQIINLQKTLNN
jgi:pentose-5-phosphate-3-epimerase